MTNAPDNAETLSQVINNFHKFSALWIKKHCLIGENPKHIFYNYWDTCITYEGSYFARINYLWFNAVKHGYVEDATQWKFGSFYERTKKWKNVKRIVEQYPFDNLKIDDDF